MTYRVGYFGRGNSGGRRGAPDERDPHERVNVVGPFVEQAKVALQFAVVSGEQDIGAIEPPALRDPTEHPAHGLVDQFVFNVNQRVDLADLIGGHFARHKNPRATFIVAEAALVPVEPVARLLPQDAFNFFARARIAGREIEIAPLDSARFTRGRVPRVMRVGKAHPYEPVVVGLQRIEVGDRPVSDPIGVVVLARNRIIGNLGSASITAGRGAEQARESTKLVRMVLLEPQ